MRVLSVCETAMGGVGIYQNYLGQLADRGVELKVLAPEQHRRLLDAGLPVTTFTRKRRGFAALRSMLREFKQLRKSMKPDIYFFHSSFALAALAVLRMGGDKTPAIYCSHGWAAKTLPAKGWKSGLVRLIEGRLSGLADCVVNVSYDERDLAESLAYRGQMVVIENAVPDVASGQEDDAALPEQDVINLLFIGRFDRQKGLDLLLSAFEKACQQRPDLRLTVIGGAVRGDIAPPVVGENVTLAGWVKPEEIDRWLAAADAVIVPSRWEGLPLVIPEAYRNGTPVLCSERSGMEKLVIRDVTGDHFPLDATAMTEVLIGLDHQSLRQMRPAARKIYQDRFSLARWSSEILTLFSSLTEKGNRT